MCFSQSTEDDVKSRKSIQSRCKGEFCRQIQINGVSGISAEVTKSEFSVNPRKESNIIYKSCHHAVENIQETRFNQIASQMHAYKNHSKVPLEPLMGSKTRVKSILNNNLSLLIFRDSDFGKEKEQLVTSYFKVIV